jgi:TM2 domain-containing membrane protein YozV
MNEENVPQSGTAPNDQASIESPMQPAVQPTPYQPQVESQPDSQVYDQSQPSYQSAPLPETTGAVQGQPDYGYGYAAAQTPSQTGDGYNLPYTGIGSPQKDKWVAAILAFALGWLGIHKFYLAYKNEGIIMLVVSIVGVICTIGLGMFVMQVIALIEAVRYVTLTQEDFQAQYVTGRKGWF